MATQPAAAQELARALTWGDVRAAVARLVDRHPEVEAVYGVPTGGSIVAALSGWQLYDLPSPHCLVIDDLVDSGRTLKRFVDSGYEVDALFRKPHSPSDVAPGATLATGWVRFPWEHSAAPEDAITRVLEHIGENPLREGLVRTPERYLKALRELTSGYEQKPEDILSAVFTEQYDQMVVVQGIKFWSLCEHHILPFEGEATVGYLPRGKILGLSKIARLVNCYARRLQVQERLTEQIAHALDDCLQPLGVGVLIRARHTCMAMRGVRAQGEMVTSCLLGELRDGARFEFLRLAGEA